MGPDNKIDRGLHQETLRRVTELSRRKEETGEAFRVKVKSVSPNLDEIKVIRPGGKTKLTYIEET